MQQTGFDVRTRSDAVAVPNTDESATRIAIKVAAPVSTTQAILTQSVRMFERALFGGGKASEQKTGISLKDARSSSAADEKSAGGSAAELKGGAELHARVEGKETRQDQGGRDGGSDQGPNKGDRTNDSAADKTSEPAKPSGNHDRSSAANLSQPQRASGSGVTVSKEDQVPERLEEVVAEVTAAMTELGSAGDSKRKKSTTDDLGDFAVGFTLVEEDDEDPKFRRFAMYAEDDDLMEEPWIIRFNDDEIYLEVHVRDPKQIPTMMEHAAQMETDLQARIGVKVVLAFKTFAKGMIL